MNDGLELSESKSLSIENLVSTDDYTDCNRCHNPLPHCHCKCPYCGLRDKCECALFEAATGG